MRSKSEEFTIKNGVDTQDTKIDCVKYDEKNKKYEIHYGKTSLTFDEVTMKKIQEDLEKGELNLSFTISDDFKLSMEYSNRNKRGLVIKKLKAGPYDNFVATQYEDSLDKNDFVAMLNGVKNGHFLSIINREVNEDSSNIVNNPAY